MGVPEYCFERGGESEVVIVRARGSDETRVQRCVCPKSFEWSLTRPLMGSSQLVVTPVVQYNANLWPSLALYKLL